MPTGNATASPRAGAFLSFAVTQHSLVANSLIQHLLLYVLFYGAAAFLALQHSSPLRRCRFGKLSPPWPVIRHELRYGLGSVMIASLYDAAIRWDVETRAGFTRVDPQLRFSRGLHLFVWILCAALLAEAHFFWTHRMLHAVPWLYKNVHKVHHESHDPNPLSGLSFHPIESTIYFSSVLLGVLLLPMNYELYHAWRIALFLFPILGHVGLGTRRYGWAWPLHMIAHYHYVHHTKVHCNYGGFPLYACAAATLYTRSRPNLARPAQLCSVRSSLARFCF